MLPPDELAEHLILDAIRRGVSEAKVDLYFHHREAIARKVLTYLREEGYAVVPKKRMSQLEALEQLVLMPEQS